jgi:hypothetical protein
MAGAKAGHDGFADLQPEPTVNAIRANFFEIRE